MTRHGGPADIRRHTCPIDASEYPGLLYTAGTTREVSPTEWDTHSSGGRASLCESLAGRTPHSLESSKEPVGRQLISSARPTVQNCPELSDSGMQLSKKRMLSRIVSNPDRSFKGYGWRTT